MILVGLFIGLLLGLTGAGGSVFAVPILILWMGESFSSASGMALVAVFSSAALGTLTRLKSNQIVWLPVFIFAVFGALFTPLGTMLSSKLNEVLLLGSFCLLVLTIAARQWRSASVKPDSAYALRATVAQSKSRSMPVCGSKALNFSNVRWPCFGRLALLASASGLLTGIYGVGGGFLIVPALIFLLGISIHQAVSSSLPIILLVSGLGAISFMLNNQDRIPDLLMLAAGGILGMALGIPLSALIAGPKLQKLFSVSMVCLAIVLLFGKIFHIT